MKKRVLVIDDDQGILEVINEILDYEGYEVKMMSECREVFNVISDFKPHLILLDYLLNDINGGEFCHLIKTNPLTEDVPVIMMSAYPRVFLSLGDYNCDVFIPKPFDLTEFTTKVKDCLSVNYKKVV